MNSKGVSAFNCKGLKTRNWSTDKISNWAGLRLPICVSLRDCNACGFKPLI